MQPVQPPTDKLDQVLTPRELEMAKQRINSSMIGSESTVKQKIKDFIDYYGDIDEIMGVSYIFDQQKQHESYQNSNILSIHYNLFNSIILKRDIGVSVFLIYKKEVALLHYPFTYKKTIIYRLYLLFYLCRLYQYQYTR